MVGIYLSGTGNTKYCIEKLFLWKALKLFQQFNKTKRFT